MSAGIWLNGTTRPASKKAVKEAIARDPYSVLVECTSMFGGFSGGLGQMEMGDRIDFVGPDPFRARNFFGTITRTASGYKVS